jgi:magnesium-transporting ATPase (P-type)
MDSNNSQYPPAAGGGNSYVGKRRSGIMVLLLSIITCGIYSFYWYYVVMEDINNASGEQRINSTTLLILSILCFPLAWVLLYKVDNNLARLARENGTFYKGNFILWLLLTFVFGVGTIVAMFQICGGLNEIWDKRTSSH